MEKIIGINDVRPKLTVLLESVNKGEEPVVITVNSEPRGVLISYREYCRFSKMQKENKKLALKLAIEKMRSMSETNGITETDISKEIKAVREQNRRKPL